MVALALVYGKIVGYVVAGFAAARAWFNKEIAAGKVRLASLEAAAKADVKKVEAAVKADVQAVEKKL